jgi:hypothetical protein
MAPLKRVLGVKMRFDSDPPLPGEDTPQGFKLNQLQAEQKRRIEADKALWKKLNRISFMQWFVTCMLTLLGIYMTWLTTSQSDRNATAGKDAAKAFLATELPKHLKSTEEIARAGGKEGGHEALAEWQKSQPIQPLVVRK